MKKTPMQKLIDNARKREHQHGDKPSYWHYRKVMNEAIELLEEEKKMVENSFNHGKMTIISSNANVPFKKGEEYFNETYGQ